MRTAILPAAILPAAILPAVVLATVLAAASPGTASAQAGPAADPSARRAQAIDQVLAQYDTDRDGRIARAEFLAQPDKRWRRLDGDGDGRVTEAEYLARYRTRSVGPVQIPGAPGGRQEERALVRFRALDRNGDRILDRGEIEAARLADFRRMDADGDGFATRAELQRGLPAPR